MQIEVTEAAREAMVADLARQLAASSGHPVCEDALVFLRDAAEEQCAAIENPAAADDNDNDDDDDDFVEDFDAFDDDFDDDDTVSDVEEDFVERLKRIQRE